MEKVTLTQKQADMLKEWKSQFEHNVQMVRRFDSNECPYPELSECLSTDYFIKALYIGYEVEQTPEDKVREQYKAPRHFLNKDEDTDADIYRKGMKFALDTLGIKIEGVNA